MKFRIWMAVATEKVDLRIGASGAAAIDDWKRLTLEQRLGHAASVFEHCNCEKRVLASGVGRELVDHRARDRHRLGRGVVDEGLQPYVVQHGHTGGGFFERPESDPLERM